MFGPSARSGRLFEPSQRVDPARKPRAVRPPLCLLAPEGIELRARSSDDLYPKPLLREPRSARGPVRRLDPAKYGNRLWATRKNPWVDRLASAWLIRCFIDPKARFKWIDGPKDRPKGSIGFHFDSADFTHAGNRVTYEVLLSSSGLEDDRALAQLAAMVYFLDAGGIPIEDAKGLELVLKGVRDNTSDDDERALAGYGLRPCVCRLRERKSGSLGWAALDVGHRARCMAMVNHSSRHFTGRTGILDLWGFADSPPSVRRSARPNLLLSPTAGVGSHGRNQVSAHTLFSIEARRAGTFPGSAP